MTVSVEVTGVVTKAGIASSIAAGRSGPQILVVGYHLGERSAREGAVALDTDVEVDGVVYTGGITDMSYSQVNEDTVIWRIRLDATVGNFDYGNVGLVLQDGSLFCKAVLPGQDYKYQSDGNSVGNTRYLNVLLRLANAASLINLSFISSLDCNLAEVADETRLPDPSTTTFNTYLTDNHTHIGVPVTSVRFNDQWWHAPHRLMPGQGVGVMPVGQGLFATGITASGREAAPAHGPVAYDPATNLFVAADGEDPSLRAVGIRTSTFEITTLGVVTAEGAGYDGQVTGIGLLYVNASPNAGRLTNDVHGSPVAVVQPNGDLYVDTTGAWRDLGLEGVLADLLALVAYEARQRRDLRRHVDQLHERVFQITRVLASGVFVGGVSDVVQTIVQNMLSRNLLPLETYALIKAINDYPATKLAGGFGAMVAFLSASNAPGSNVMQSLGAAFSYPGGDLEELALSPWLLASPNATPPGVGINPTNLFAVIAELRSRATTVSTI